VVSRDDDGITLYFFSTQYEKFTHINTAELVDYYFNQVPQPKGGSHLSLALQDAIIPDNADKPKTIIIISDSIPDNREEIERICFKAAENMEREDELRILFVHVGTDYQAMKWLTTLKSKSSNCSVDIIEIVSSKKLLKQGIPFAQWVSRNVMPELLTRVDMSTDEV
jgi:hypothetical protein